MGLKNKMPTFLLISAVAIFIIIPFDLISAQSGLVVFISSNTEWTKANSPYTLTGPTVVNPGITLTIDGGVVVNLNGYTLYVNGTIKALGTALEKIQVNGPSITFGASATDQSLFQNTEINAPISGNATITFSNDRINNVTTVGGSTIFSGCTIKASINAGKAISISNSEILGDVTVGDSSTLSGNTITGDVTTGNIASVTRNSIIGSKYQRQAFGGYYYTVALTVGNGSTVTSNTISGGVTAVSSTISGNTISGGSRFTDWAGRSEDATSALAVKGTCTVTSNALFSNTGGYGLLIQDGPTTVLGNSINNSLRIAGKAVVDSNFVIGGIQVGRIYISAFNEIDYGSSNATVKNNICSGSYYGIYSSYAGGTATIQNNLVTNCTYGISLVSNATVQSNTIYGSKIAIYLTDISPLINNNNILSYSQNSLFMNSNPLNVNATYNWWGTPDTQTIGLSIHDFKYDLNLGAVNIQPILTSPNSAAPAISYTLQVPPFPTGQQASGPTPLPTDTTPTSNPSATSSASENPSQTTTGQPTANQNQIVEPSVPEYTTLMLIVIILTGTVLAFISVKIGSASRKSGGVANN